MLRRQPPLKEEPRAVRLHSRRARMALAMAGVGGEGGKGRQCSRSQSSLCWFGKRATGPEGNGASRRTWPPCFAGMRDV